MWDESPEASHTFFPNNISLHIIVITVNLMRNRQLSFTLENTNNYYLHLKISKKRTYFRLAICQIHYTRQNKIKTHELSKEIDPAKLNCRPILCVRFYDYFGRFGS